MEQWIEFGIDNYIKTIEDGKLFQGENEAVFKQVFFEEQLKLHKRYKTVKNVLVLIVRKRVSKNLIQFHEKCP